jgi:hypothetical protein
MVGEAQNCNKKFHGRGSTKKNLMVGEAQKSEKRIIMDGEAQVSERKFHGEESTKK